MMVNNIRTTVEPLGHKFTINLDRVITDPEDFQEELLTIRQCGEGDVCHILLSSGGGSAETMKCFLSAIEQCRGEVVCEITGDIASAATFIFLAGDQYIISDNAEAMFHWVSYGSVGKGSDVKRHVDFTHKSSEKLVRKYYKDFLTEDEIDLLIDGKEYWMDSDDIMKRLEKRQELRQEDQKNQESSMMEEMFSEMGFPSEEELLEMSKEELIEFILGGEEPHPDLPDGVVALDLEHLNCRGLKAMADSLEIEYAKNVSEKKLRKMIEDSEEGMNDE